MKSGPQQRFSKAAPDREVLPINSGDFSIFAYTQQTAAEHESAVIATDEPGGPLQGYPVKIPQAVERSLSAKA